MRHIKIKKQYLILGVAGMLMAATSCTSARSIATDSPRPKRPATDCTPRTIHDYRTVIPAAIYQEMGAVRTR